MIYEGQLRKGLTLALDDLRQMLKYELKDINKNYEKIKKYKARIKKIREMLDR